MTDAITAILSVPAILALITIAKDLGLPSKLAPVAAIVVGVVLAVLNHLLAGTPVWGAIASGLLLGLSASGVYDTAKLTNTDKASS